MFRLNSLLLLALLFCCRLPAQKKIPANNSTATSYGDWVMLGQKEVEGLVRDKNNVYLFTNHDYNKKELYKVNNNKLELFLGEDILSLDRSSFQPLFDSKSNLYFLYSQLGGAEIIRKWDGTKLVPFGDEPGKKLSLYRIYIDPLDNVIGAVRPLSGNRKTFIIFKNGKWQDMGMEDRSDFSYGLYVKGYRNDLAGNFYVYSRDIITKWDGQKWTDIPMQGLGSIDHLFFSATNVLHVVVNGSYYGLNGENTGTIKKFENGEWSEVKLGQEFFQQPDIKDIYYTMAGSDKMYAKVDFKEDMTREQEQHIYSWKNGQWENITQGKTVVSPGDNYLFEIVNNELYLINLSKDFLAKWDPAKPITKKASTTKNTAPALIYSQKKFISAILPGSRCVITATMYPKTYGYSVGDTLMLRGPAYCFDSLWYTTAMAVNGKNEVVTLSDFKAKIIYQPGFTSNAKCDSYAETSYDNFGFAKGTKVKILAVGDLDKDQYARASSYIGNVYTVYSSAHPISECWYWGMFEREGKLHIINCVQIQRVYK